MKLVLSGLASIALSIYLLFFDKVPFAAPWGLVFGAFGVLCLRQEIIRRAEK